MDTAFAGGWPGLREHLFSWVVSVQTGRRFFDSAHLVADSRSAELLIDRLGLRFDGVSLELDALDHVDADLWAMGKLHAYRAQQHPFLHIDSDVYLWSAPPPACYSADVFATYKEARSCGDPGYRWVSLKADIARVGGWLPVELDQYMPGGGVLEAENCAVLGGCRTDFLRAYADAAIRLLDHEPNRRAWDLRRPMGRDMLILEQHLLSAFLRYHAGRDGSPFAMVRAAHMFADESACFAGGGAAGFTHLISRAKHNEDVLARLDRRVQCDYPAFYERASDIAGTAVRAAVTGTGL